MTTAKRSTTTKMTGTRTNVETKKQNIENKMNQHMRLFNKMFRVGSNHEHESRVEMATHSTNTPAPPLYGVRKDHKTSVVAFLAEKETNGPEYANVTRLTAKTMTSFLAKVDKAKTSMGVCRK